MPSPKPFFLFDFLDWSLSELEDDDFPDFDLIATSALPKGRAVSISVLAMTSISAFG